MKRYIRCSDDSFAEFNSKFQNADPITQEYKQKLDALFNDNASDQAFEDLLNSAAYDITDNADYSLLYDYFDLRYRNQYIPYWFRRGV